MNHSKYGLDWKKQAMMTDHMLSYFMMHEYYLICKVIILFDYHNY